MRRVATSHTTHTWRTRYTILWPKFQICFCANFVSRMVLLCDACESVGRASCYCRVPIRRPSLPCNLTYGRVFVVARTVFVVIGTRVRVVFKMR